MSDSALSRNNSHAFRRVLDLVPVPCWIHSGGVVLYANPALARLLRARAPEELLGRRVPDMIPADTRVAFDVRVSRLLAGEEVQPCEQELSLVNGGTVSVEVASTAISYEGNRVILSFFQDITEQRRAERALRQSEIRYRRLVEGEIVGVLEFTAEGIHDANDAFLRLIGRKREDLPQGRMEWRAVSPPEDSGLDREKLAQLIETGECKPFEKEFLRPDGSRVPVLMGASLVERPPEWRAIALVIDQTDRRRLQQIQLEKLRLESVEVLAAGMAHNLNNILTGVIGNASLLIENGLVPPESHAASTAAEILESGERAAALTAQLLAYAGQGRFVLCAADLREIVESVVERIRRELPGNIRLTTRISGEMPAFPADADQLRRLVIALVDNAVEAIGGRKEGAITVEARVEQIGDACVLSRHGEPLPPGEYCVIEVRDNGAGMDSNTLAHAFDPFFSTKFPGRGLGLAAVAGIVRAAHGAIQVSSSPGVGTSFRVYLPAR